MKILYVTSEAVPFIKTGGLGDVSGSLPKAIKNCGGDIRVIMPKYKLIAEKYKSKMSHVCDFTLRLGWREQYCGIETLTNDGITYYFIDNEYYFGRDYVYGDSNMDECERFSFFSRAVIEAMFRCDFDADIVHCNDWQTGMIPFLLKTQYHSNKRSIFTIHNLHYQGLFSWDWVKDILSIDYNDGIAHKDCVSFIKAGIVYSDSVTTVSPSYANEVKLPFYGEGMEEALKSRGNSLVGIINGMDMTSFDPKTDKSIACNYDVNDLSGKAKCKEALQEEMWLDKERNTPLLAIVSRLVEIKGLPLVERIIDELIGCGVQLAILGTGEKRFEEFFRSTASKYGGRVSIKLEYNDGLSRRMYAGSDMFIMPSLIEPCGLAQMMAMRYGSVPIVRETGGLRDSVMPYNKFTGEGIGFSFCNYNAHELLFTVKKALECFSDKQVWNGIVKRGMMRDSSWDLSAMEYMKLYGGRL